MCVCVYYCQDNTTNTAAVFGLIITSRFTLGNVGGLAFRLEHTLVHIHNYSHARGSRLCSYLEIKHAK